MGAGGSEVRSTHYSKTPLLLSRNSHPARFSMHSEGCMISLALGGRTRLCDSWTRREVLRVGGLSALGLTLPDWLRAEAAGAVAGRRRAKSVILIFNCGAPSHIDLWDPKPDAPAEVRGPFKPIPTNVAGIRVSELMPE